MIWSRVSWGLNCWGTFWRRLLLSLILFKLLNLCILLHLGLLLPHLLSRRLLIFSVLFILIPCTRRFIRIPLIFILLLRFLLMCGPRRCKCLSLITASVSWNTGWFWCLILDDNPPIITAWRRPTWQSWWYLSLSIDRWWVIGRRICRWWRTIWSWVQDCSWLRNWHLFTRRWFLGATQIALMVRLS